MTLLIAILTFAATSMLIWYRFQPKENVLRRRLFAEGGGVGFTEERRIEGGIGERVIRPALRHVGGQIAQMLPQNAIAGLAHWLEMADSRVSVVEYLGMWLALIGAGFGL